MTDTEFGKEFPSQEVKLRRSHRTVFEPLASRPQSQEEPTIHCCVAAMFSTNIQELQLVKQQNLEQHHARHINNATTTTTQNSDLTTHLHSARDNVVCTHGYVNETQLQRNTIERTKVSRSLPPATSQLAHVGRAPSTSVIARGMVQFPPARPVLGFLLSLV